MSIRLDFVWEKPVLVFYRDRREEPERKAFAVVKARKLMVSRNEEDAEFKGDIKDFFPLMGNLDNLSTGEGASGRYVLCWFEDEEDDFRKAWRRLTGVTFPNGITFVTDEEGKTTYNANFRAIKSKLQS